MTELNRVSYSSLINYKNCPRYFKLVNVELVKDFSNNPKTIHGTLLHEGSQDVLSGKLDLEKVNKRFSRKWMKLAGIYKKHIDKKKINVVEMEKAGLKIFSTIQDSFQNEFGNFKVLAIEEKLFENIDNFPQSFKGFIDIVLELEDGTIIIADFKTCDSTFFFKKYKDKYKDYQLTLYKHFYCKAHNINPDKVRTCFVLLERSVKTRSLISFLEVGASKIKVANALQWMNKCLKGINRSFFMKNRSYCMMYGKPCSFWHSEKCGASNK